MENVETSDDSHELDIQEVTNFDVALIQNCCVNACGG